MAALETREDQNPLADISESVGTTLEGQVVGTPPGILHPLPAPDPLHAPGDGGHKPEEFGHLFGDARFRTIRAHCLAYEGMQDRLPEPPLDGRRRPAPHEPGGHVGGHPGEAPEVVGHFKVALH